MTSLIPGGLERQRRANTYSPVITVARGNSTLSNLRGNMKARVLFNKKDLSADRVIILEAEMTVF